MNLVVNIMGWEMERARIELDEPMLWVEPSGEVVVETTKFRVGSFVTYEPEAAIPVKWVGVHGPPVFTQEAIDRATHVVLEKHASLKDGAK